MSNITVEQAKKVLLENGFIDIFWTVEDIKSTILELETETEFTPDDFQKMADYIGHNHDTSIGMSWEIMETLLESWIGENPKY